MPSLPLYDQLSDLILTKDLLGIEQLLASGDFRWSKVYKDEQNDGLLYELFPENHAERRLKCYDALLSKTCLDMFLKSGFDPREDPSMNEDFFTECARPCFADFAEVLKQHPKQLGLVCVELVKLSAPFYKEHFEYLVCPALNEMLIYKETFLEYLWDILNHEADDLDDDIATEYILTTQALLALGNPPRMPELVSLMDQMTTFAHQNNTMHGLPEDVRGFKALMERHLLAQEVERTPTALVARKM